MESLDLVIVGAYKGKSKLSHLYSSFLMACSDEDGKLMPLTKCGVGFDIETLEKLTEKVE